MACCLADIDRAVQWIGEQERGSQLGDGAVNDACSLLVREATWSTASQPDGDSQPDPEVLRRAV